jgi:C2H2 type zinc finger protein
LVRRASRGKEDLMQDLKCKECGQSFKSPGELEEHTDRLHGVGKKGGEPIVGNPPSERRR